MYERLDDYKNDTFWEFYREIQYFEEIDYFNFTEVIDLVFTKINEKFDIYKEEFNNVCVKNFVF